MIRIFTPDGKPGKSEMMHHHINYHLPMLVLTAGNLLLGLNSGFVVELISKGLEMFR